MQLRHCLAAVVAATLLGCASSGDYVKPEDAKKASRARTAKEVIKALGPPTMTLPIQEGKTMWVYSGIQTAPSPDSFIPVLGAVTGRQNQTCTRLTMMVDDKSGAVSDMKYVTRQDTDWQYFKDTKCE